MFAETDRPVVYTPDNEPYLGRNSVFQLDKLGLGHMTLDAGGKGTLGIGFTEKCVACYKTKR